MDKEMIEEEGSLQSCDPMKMDCRDCVWAFVYGLSPISSSCGKFGKKPNAVYFKNAKCSKKQAFKK